MDQLQTPDTNSWKLQIYHLLLSLDLLEDYCSDQSPETFGSALPSREFIAENLHEISLLAKNIPALIRCNYPNVPWKLLKDIETYLSVDFIARNPYVAHVVLHRRVLACKPILLDIIQGIESQPLGEDDGMHHAWKRGS